APEQIERFRVEGRRIDLLDSADDRTLRVDGPLVEIETFHLVEFVARAKQPGPRCSLEAECNAVEMTSLYQIGVVCSRVAVEVPAEIVRVDAGREIHVVGQPL